MASYTLKAVIQDDVLMFPIDKTAGGGTTVTYINKVWDTQEPGWVTWVSENLPDSTGASYPGPGTWGVHTSNYRVAGSY